MRNQDELNEWDKFIGHPLQSYLWGEFRQITGVKVIRFIDNEKQHFQITFHPIPHTPFTIGYLPKGLLPTTATIHQLIELGKKNNAIYIQLEPNTNYSAAINLQLLTINHLRPSHHPLFTKYTFVLDLTQTETELLSAMHPKTRYNIKIAQKHQVTVKIDNSDLAFQKFLTLTHETTSRQGFYAHNSDYLTKMWQTLKTNQMAQLWTASVHDEIIATWIIFCYKDTIYYPYGASSRQYKETMAPTLLLWEIAKWGKSNGYNKFDLWGAIGPNPDPKDPWYGFHRFKEGFHPKLVEYLGSYDLIINPFLYRIFVIADRLRWKLLNVMK